MIARARRRALLFGLWACATGFPTVAGAAVREHDDRGVPIALSAPAARIVSLAPHVTELVYAAGAGDRIVGVVRFSDFPAAAARLPSVGDAARVDVERILHLKPDLVLAWQSGNPTRDVERLERMGVPVFVTEPRRLPDIARLLATIGRLAGTVAQARRAEQEFTSRIDALTSAFAHRPPVRVFYEIWHRPLLTVGGTHLIDDVLRRCGGRNVFARERSLTPTVSYEAMLAAQPEVILGGGSEGDARAFRARWRDVGAERLRDTPVFHVAPDLIQRPTPRIADGVQAVCDALELYRRARR